MKKSRLLGAVFTCVCLLISLSAGATTVVDTGPAAPGFHFPRDNGCLHSLLLQVITPSAV